MRRFRLVILMVCAFAFGSCAQTRTVKTRIHEDRRTGVALHKLVDREKVPFPRGYSHPAKFDVGDLKFLLGTVRYQDKGLFDWSDVKRVFTAGELYRLSPHLVDALGKATPDDEVIFRLTTAKPGVVFSSERYTDGRIFIKDKKLNCLFANVNIKSGVSEIYDGNPRNFYSGVLWRLVEKDGQSLVEGEKGLHYNWIELDIERGLAKRKQIKEAYKKMFERRRAVKQERQFEETDWEDWELEQDIEEEIEQDEDVYFPPESP